MWKKKLNTKNRDKILTAKLGLWINSGLLIYIPAYLEEQRRKKKVSKILHVYIYMFSTSKQRAQPEQIKGDDRAQLPESSPSRERERERERDPVYIHVRERVRERVSERETVGERERSPRQRQGREAPGRAVASRLSSTERERERERDRKRKWVASRGSYPFLQYIYIYIFN